MGGKKNQGDGQQSENLETNGPASDFQSQRVRHIAPHSWRYKAGRPARVYCSKDKKSASESGRNGIIEIDKGQQQKTACKKNPFFLFEAPSRRKADDQRKKDVEIEQVVHKFIGVEGQDPEGLRNQRENAQTKKVFFDIFCI